MVKDEPGQVFVQHELVVGLEHLGPEDESGTAQAEQVPGEDPLHRVNGRDPVQLAQEDDVGSRELRRCGLELEGDAVRGVEAPGLFFAHVPSPCRDRLEPRRIRVRFRARV